MMIEVRRQAGAPVENPLPGSNCETFHDIFLCNSKGDPSQRRGREIDNTRFKYAKLIFLGCVQSAERKDSSLVTQ